jgi:hypothetical protein
MAPSLTEPASGDTAILGYRDNARFLPYEDDDGAVMKRALSRLTRLSTISLFQNMRLPVRKDPDVGSLKEKGVWGGLNWLR